MLAFFAHAGEAHDTPVQATSHYLQEWYIALPLLALALVGTLTIIYFATKKSKPITFLCLVALLLVVGVWSYSYAPVVSIVALSVGMGLILFSVLVSLAAGKKP